MKMKSCKRVALVFALILAFSLIACICASAEEVSVAEVDSASIDGLVSFDGYSARKISYNGLRAQYTLDTGVLAELEKSFSVEIGMLMASSSSDNEEVYLALTKDNAVISTVFYTTEDKYVGSYYDTIADDGKYEFVYALTYTSAQSQSADAYRSGVMYRAYVSLTDESGESTTFYIDNVSATFGYVISLFDIAGYYASTESENFPMLQRVVSECNGNPLENMMLMGVEIDKYSIVIDKESSRATATAFNNAFETATGYRLPVLVKNGTYEDTAYYSDAYISVDTSASLASSSSYKVMVSQGKAEIMAKSVSGATKAAKAFAEALVKGNYGVIASIKYDPDWSSPIK